MRRTSDATGSTSTRDDRKKFEKHKKVLWKPLGSTSTQGSKSLHLRTASEDQLGRTLDTMRTKEYEKTRKTVPRASGEVLDHFLEKQNRLRHVVSRPRGRNKVSQNGCRLLSILCPKED
jgi:hypothetical protein